MITKGGANSDNKRGIKNIDMQRVHAGLEPKTSAETRQCKHKEKSNERLVQDTGTFATRLGVVNKRKSSKNVVGACLPGSSSMPLTRASYHSFLPCLATSLEVGLADKGGYYSRSEKIQKSSELGPSRIRAGFRPRTG